MGRSRSRSPVRRERRRSRSRSRSPRRRRRSRSRSPRRRRSRSSSPRGHRNRSPSPGSSKEAITQPSRPVIDESQLEGKTEEEIEMMKIMGFAGFDTTKGKHVPGSNNASFVSIQPKRKYRQYMNRRGGFNRPLDFIA
ncbi:U4/U6.U5 small nuclear ribonucleoprotein 27 kDa protein-like isoform X2 [Acanthaster planci]|uniref:U4/U6.U5 small nuclear ribonucleoprotein 27 kDa protein n=1 Tax=Acanthaster planci TaxID=133434 RepID=A0A8B7Z0E0_ACAPL|nr:U4/U6.U5 small nuclear ribonucleoprotein 27 kDa protein-like isoform X2 [Acanthaster planci]